MFNPLEQLNQSALNESLLQSASLESDSLAPLPIESLPEVTDLFQQSSLPVENFADPAPVPTPTPSPSPAPVPTPAPSPSPAPVPTPTPVPSPTPSPIPEPPVPTPTPTPTIPTTDPGSDPSTAYDLGVLNGSLTVQQDVGDADTIDGYSFSLSQDGDISLLLDGLSADADLKLYDSTGATVLAESINSDTAADSISASLTAGTYHVVILQGVPGASTSYNLTLSNGAVPTPGPVPTPTPTPTIPTTDPGSDPSTAYDLGVLNGSLTVQQDVGDADTIDGYTFSLSQDGDISLLLDGLSADANLRLYDSTGQTILAESINSDTAADSISASLTAGIYHAVILQGVPGANTSYNLTLSNGAVPTPGPVPTPTPTPTIPTTDPGSDPSTAYDLGVLNGSLTVQQDVGDADTIDGYTFSLSQDGDISLLLDGLSADADLKLYDSTGQTILAESINSDTAADSISASLTAGTYHAVILQGVPGANTSYNLTLSNGAVPTPGPIPPPTGEDPGNTLADAAAQTSPIFSQSQQISASDSDDFYSFTVDQSGVFSADLTGLTGDADVRLIQDSNSNGQVDQGEVQAWQWERSTGSESIRSFVEAGNYFLQVNSYNSQTADYAVATNFTAAASDEQDFSIEINFGQGSEGLSDAMRTAVVEAADLWESVIPHSSFNGNHTLTIDVGGTVQEWGPDGRILASASWRELGADAAGHAMPISGFSNINTNPDAVAALSSNIDYFRGVMAHEFGHVLGIGSLWGTETASSNTGPVTVGRNLIDTLTGTYNANTNAGWAYGELLGTFTQTAIELTNNTGNPGSDFGHWREEVFDNELMTHLAGGQREGLPLSQMTIAALNDMGWNVNYGAAEPFSMPDSLDSSSNAVASGSSDSLSNLSCGCGLCGSGSNLLSPRLVDMVGVQETALI